MGPNERTRWLPKKRLTRAQSEPLFVSDGGSDKFKKFRLLWVSGSQPTLCRSDRFFYKFFKRSVVYLKNGLSVSLDISASFTIPHNFALKNPHFTFIEKC